MKNHIQEPLICLQMIEINTATMAIGAPVVKVTTDTHKLPSGSWETIGYVNGRPVCSSSNPKAKQQTIIDVREMLAEGGHFVEKQLAPVMSARLEKKSTRKAA